MSRRFIVLIAMSALLTPICVHSQSSQSQLLDEFGKLNSEDSSARFQRAMGQLAIRLADRPNARLQFMLHRSNDEPIGAPYRIFGIYKAFFLSEHFDLSRMVFTVCEPRVEMNTQIWMIDSLAQQHSCTPDEIRLNSTTLFVTSYAPNDDLALGGCCMIDEVGYAATMETIKSFAAFVTARPGTNAYVVVYGGTNKYGLGDSHGRMRDVRNLDLPSFVNKLTRELRKQLLDAGLDQTRTVLVNGGYRDSTASVDLWIVPPGGKRPKPTPNYFPGLTRHLRSSRH